jgi:hypothetical protein
MKSNHGPDVAVDVAAVKQVIEACDNASAKIGGILYTLRLHGQTSQSWAADAVSHDVASHYTLQLWSGKYCTYSALDNYYEELVAAAETLRRTLADYNNFDGTTAESLERL